MQVVESGREWSVTVEFCGVMTCHVVPVCKTQNNPTYLHRKMASVPVFQYSQYRECASDLTRKQETYIAKTWRKADPPHLQRQFKSSAISAWRLRHSAFTVRDGASRCRGSCEEAVTRRQDWMRLVMFDLDWPRSGERWTGTPPLGLSLFGRSEGIPDMFFSLFWFWQASPTFSQGKDEIDMGVRAE